MSVTSPVAIADAITADILANTDLVPKSTRKYAEPTVVLPKVCPLLAVWNELSTYRLLSAGIVAYERVHMVNVAWYVLNPKEAETGGSGDPAIVEALDATLEMLVAQLASYTEGLPGGLGPQMIGTLQARQLKPQEGMLWRGLVELAVEEAT